MHKINMCQRRKTKRHVRSRGKGLAPGGAQPLFENAVDDDETWKSLFLKKYQEKKK